MSWDCWQLDDAVEFVPVGSDRPAVAGGHFVVFAQSRKAADKVVRTHLCFMLASMGLMQIERSESPDDLAQ